MKKTAPRALLGATAAMVLVLSGACSTDEPQEGTTTPRSEAIIEVPGEGEEPAEPSEGGGAGEPGEGGEGAEDGEHADTDTDMHDHTHGDLDDAPEVEELDEIHSVAGDYWVANTELRYDHPDGPAQVLEQIRPYVTDRYYDYRAELMEGSGREVWWMDFFHEEREIAAQLRDATFRPDQPFTADRVHVWVEGAVVDNSPNQNRRLSDADSTFVMIEVERTDQGWRVDETIP